MNRFNNKTAIVTGASSGIGQAIALRLASEGANVLCLDVAEVAVKDTVTQITQLGGKASHLLCDVSNIDQVKAAISQCMAQYGQLDVLVNSAGVIRLDHATNISDELWHKIISVNLTGTFFMCREAIPHLIASQGNIVNISSTSAIRGLPYGIAYAASKGGVSALTKSIAVEFAKQGIRANTVCPGSIATNMQKESGLPKDIDWQLIPRIASINGQMGSPGHIAGVVALIASEQDGKHINGAEYVVDGGTTT